MPSAHLAASGMPLCPKIRSANGGRVERNPVARTITSSGKRTTCSDCGVALDAVNGAGLEDDVISDECGIEIVGQQHALASDLVGRGKSGTQLRVGDLNGEVPQRTLTYEVDIESLAFSLCDVLLGFPEEPIAEVPGHLRIVLEKETFVLGIRAVIAWDDIGGAPLEDHELVGDPGQPGN